MPVSLLYQFNETTKLFLLVKAGETKNHLPVFVFYLVYPLCKLFGNYKQQ